MGRKRGREEGGAAVEAEGTGDRLENGRGEGVAQGKGLDTLGDGKTHLDGSKREDLDLSTLHALVVLTDRKSRAELSRILRSCHYTPHEVEGVQEGLTELLNAPTKFDIVIAECLSNTKSGLKFLKKKQRDGRINDIPVVLTAPLHVDRDVLIQGLNFGAVEFLVQPFREAEIAHLWMHVWRSRNGLFYQRKSEMENNLKLMNKSEEAGTSGESDSRLVESFRGTREGGRREEEEEANGGGGGLERLKKSQRSAYKAKSGGGGGQVINSNRGSKEEETRKDEEGEEEGGGGGEAVPPTKHLSRAGSAFQSYPHSPGGGRESGEDEKGERRSGDGDAGLNQTHHHQHKNANKTSDNNGSCSSYEGEKSPHDTSENTVKEGKMKPPLPPPISENKNNSNVKSIVNEELLKAANQAAAASSSLPMSIYGSYFARPPMAMPPGLPGMMAPPFWPGAFPPPSLPLPHHPSFPPLNAIMHQGPPGGPLGPHAGQQQVQEAGMGTISVPKGTGGDEILLKDSMHLMENGGGGKKSNGNHIRAVGGDIGIKQNASEEGRGNAGGGGNIVGVGLNEDAAEQCNNAAAPPPDLATARRAALTKYRIKRSRRCFQKKIRYESRKQLANARPRVRGQFVSYSNNGGQNSGDASGGSDGTEKDTCTTRRGTSRNK